MKKTKLMRAALLLLVLTLITSCFVGGTFAKYVTDGKSTDSARVAKWGVTVTADSKTFAKAYDSDVNIKTVISADESKVVAPGTSGKMAAVTLSGTPEVAVKVSCAATFDVKGWTVDNAFYCPLVIKVGEQDITATGKTEEQFEKDVTDAIAGYSKEYAAGEDLSTKGADALAVSWEWAFEGNDDVKDTALGNLTTAPTVTLKITTTVTQID